MGARDTGHRGRGGGLVDGLAGGPELPVQEGRRRPAEVPLVAMVVDEDVGHPTDAPSQALE